MVLGNVRTKNFGAIVFRIKKYIRSDAPSANIDKKKVGTWFKALK